MVAGTIMHTTPAQIALNAEWIRTVKATQDGKARPKNMFATAGMYDADGN
mgnify:FL=1